MLSINVMTAEILKEARRLTYNARASKRIRAWRAEHKEESLERERENSRNWLLAHPERVAAKNRDRLYGQGAHEHFVEQVSKQEGRCAICGKQFVSPKETHLDHNHLTEQLRGALCASCNKALGIIENTDWMQKALQYLRCWEGKQ